MNDIRITEEPVQQHICDDECQRYCEKCGKALCRDDEFAADLMFRDFSSAYWYCSKLCAEDAMLAEREIVVIGHILKPLQ